MGYRDLIKQKKTGASVGSTS